MGSCANVRFRSKTSKTSNKTESSENSVKDCLASHILALHRLEIECKFEIENCGINKDLPTAVLLKQKQLEIQVYLKEIRDLLKKFDFDEENRFPDRLRLKILGEQGSKLLGKIFPDRIAEEIKGILGKNKKIIQNTRKMSQKLNFPDEIIREYLKKELDRNDGIIVRKKYRRRKSSFL
jgi:hypothetical protein